jgi:hypothetical protein
MEKSKALLEDHRLHTKGTPLSDPKRKTGLQNLLSPILAACLLTCGITQGAETEKEIKAAQLRAEAQALLSGSSLNQQRKMVAHSQELLEVVEEKLEEANQLDPSHTKKEKKEVEIGLLGGKNQPGRLIPQGGDPKLGTTITIHGINDSSESVQSLGRKAQQTGEALTTFAWDDKSRRLTDTADDLSNALKTILQAHPNAPITINAHSMGGRMAAVSVGRLEKTGALAGKNLQLNLIAPPLQGVASANMSWMGADIAPSLKSSIDMGTGSKFQKELEGIALKNAQAHVYGAADDLVAPPNEGWQKIATRLTGGIPPTILEKTTHDDAPQKTSELLNQTAPKNPEIGPKISLPNTWAKEIEDLHKKVGKNPTRADLVEFHRKTQIAAEVEDAATFLCKHRNINPQSPDGELVHLQTQIDVERIWKESHQNIPPEREKEIRRALETLTQNKTLELVGNQGQNQLADTHRERLAVARDLNPQYNPFNGREDIQESLKSRLQTTTNPTNEGKPTKNIVIIGEKHHEEKNRDLYPALLENLHKKGFRTLSLEFPENHNKTPLETLVKTLKNTPSSIEQDKLMENHVRSHGLSKEWIATYAKAQQLGWDIQLTDKPIKNITEDIHALENKKETLIEGHALTPQDAENIEKKKTNLAGLPREVWAEVNKTENAQIESRSKYIAENLAKIPGKVVHIGGSLHTSEVQDAYAQITGKRPVGLQIDYTPHSNPLQKLTNPSPEDKMEKHLDINKRTARHSKNCFELPCNPTEALKTLDKVTTPKEKTPDKPLSVQPQM